MAKAILMSIKPKYVSMILNKTKTIEVRKHFPKDYVGWVYIYCTKGKETLYLDYERDLTGDYCFVDIYKPFNKLNNEQILNGKLVARFWCDKVEEITPSTTNNFTKDSCLTIQELENYLWSNILFGYAIHITNLEIFNEPKELSEFKFYCEEDFCHCYYEKCKDCSHLVYEDENYCDKKLTRAPQSWCYVEI